MNWANLLIGLVGGIAGGAIHHAVHNALTLNPKEAQGLAKVLHTSEAEVEAVDQVAVTAADAALSAQIDKTAGK